MKQLDSEGRLHFPKNPNGRLRLKMYLDESEGVALQDVWTDVMLASSSPERLGYPTQKPLALLERIVASSSEEGDVILDPFCGCGTSIDAAQRLKRKWIGIDITHLAIGLIKHRLRDSYGPEVEKTYKVIGEPEDLAGARQLAEEDKYQFQWWALGLVGARPVEQKKGADKGIDGRLLFHDDPRPGARTKHIVISVKGGHLKATDVRDLRGVIDREQADIGVLISMEKPTALMKKEAASAGFYKSETFKKQGVGTPIDRPYPKLQLLTIEELLDGRDIAAPPRAQTSVTHKKAPKAAPFAEQLTLDAGRASVAADEDPSE